MNRDERTRGMDRDERIRQINGREKVAMHMTTRRARRLKPWHAARLRPKHLMVASLAASGLTNVEISSITGYTQARVSVILNDPRIQEYLEDIAFQTADVSRDVRQRLEELSNEALDTAVEIMRGSGDDRVSLTASFGILDRAGYSKVDKKIIATAELSERAASILSDAMIESRSIDVDYDQDVSEYDEEDSE